MTAYIILFIFFVAASLLIAVKRLPKLLTRLEVSELVDKSAQDIIKAILVSVIIIIGACLIAGSVLILIETALSVI